MARYTKSLLAVGTYKKAGEPIRIRPDDLKTAIDSFNKIRSRGYKIPVIMEHSDKADPDGLPFKPKKQNLTARDLAKYQEGWADDLRINEKGELEADVDVRGKDGLKLIQDVKTYVSPQFGRWKDPDSGEELPMAITHIALTPVPVDIGQNPEFKEIPETDDVLEASQLSHLVSFSMADMVKEKPRFTPKTTPDMDEDGDRDEDDAGEANSIMDQMPQVDSIVDPVAGQVIEMLKSHGIVLPEGTEIGGELKVLLAGLMSAAHAKAMQSADAAAQQNPQQQRPVVPGRPNSGQQQDPRFLGTKQENTITMSQTPEPKVTPEPIDIKSLPEFIQMSQRNDALESEITNLKREKYNARIEKLQGTGRVSQKQADDLRAVVNTYQFSTSASSTDIVKLDAKLEMAEELPEGATWSPDQRITQMSMVEHKRGGFFETENREPSAEEVDKMLDLAGFPSGR